MADHVSVSIVCEKLESLTNGSEGFTNRGDSPDEYKETKKFRMIGSDLESLVKLSHDNANRRNALDQCKEPKNGISKPFSCTIILFFCHQLVRPYFGQTNNLKSQSENIRCQREDFE